MDDVKVQYFINSDDSGIPYMYPDRPGMEVFASVEVGGFKYGRYVASFRRGVDASMFCRMMEKGQVSEAGT